MKPFVTPRKSHLFLLHPQTSQKNYLQRPNGFVSAHPTIAVGPTLHRLYWGSGHLEQCDQLQTESTRTRDEPIRGFSQGFDADLHPKWYALPQLRHRGSNSTGGPLRCSSCTEKRPSSYVFLHLRTIWMLITFSPQTEVTFRWMSQAVTPFHFKNLTILHNRTPARGRLTCLRLNRLQTTQAGDLKRLQCHHYN